MKITPHSNHILVKRDPAQDRIGMFYAPDSAVRVPTKGTVEAVGPGAWEAGQLIPMGVRVGDRIIFSEFAGNQIKSGDEDILLLTDDDVLGTIIEE